MFQTSEFFLPFHFGKHILVSAEEVCDLAVLIISFGGEVDAVFGFLRQVLAYLGDWEHDLLQGPVMADYFDLTGVRLVEVQCGVGVLFAVAICRYRTQLDRQLFVVLRQLSVSHTNNVNIIVN